MKLIVAMDREGGIGKGGKIPWKILKEETMVRLNEGDTSYMFEHWVRA